MASTAGIHSPPQPGYASPPQQQYAAYLSGAQQQLYQQAAASVRPGTLPPGVCVKIGEHEVTIERFLSEGGFAHVYVVRSSRPIPSPGGSSEVLHVLKRVAVPDKPTLKEVRWEVDVMKLLRGHKHIVNLIEASAAPIPGTPGYEVFILMEYCSGGGIIDMMNTRLQNRLTEAEILTIFSDVVEGVCWMHTRNPPLMHRDLKVENILLAGQDFYKVCDFGSSTTPKRAPQSMQEIQLLEAELNKHTTLQYRAPEMCDVWSRKEVGLPADIWALGVLLYKLCFYTTPFEEQGPLAILNVQYKMPSYPNYSQDIRSLIASMLVEPIDKRPTAWQVHQQVCRLRGTKPNKDYEQHKSLDVHLSPSHASLNGAVSPSFSSRPTSSTSGVLTGPSTIQSRSAEAGVQDQLGVSPMRRGRPNKSGPNPSSLHTEWHVPSAAESHSSASAPAVHHVTAGSHNPYASHEGGFTDSFAPTAAALTGEREQPRHLVASPEATGSKTASATAALFQEMSHPGSTVKAAPTLASLAAERSGGGHSAPSNATGQKTQQYMQQFSQPSARPSTSAQDLRRISPGKPLGPRPALPVPGAVQATSFSHNSKKSTSPEQNTREEHSRNGPPVKAPKPNLVSRASQTSPTLLNEWKQKQQVNVKGHHPSRTSSLRDNSPSHQGKPEERTASATEGEDLQRFPSIDDWESTGFSPPVESTASVPSSSQPLPGSSVQKPMDLLGDDVDGLGGQAPTRSISYHSSGHSLPSRQASSAEAGLGASSSESRLRDSGDSAEASGHSLEGPHILQLPTQESSSSDSEDEEGPEEPTGHHYGTLTPPAVISSEKDQLPLNPAVGTNSLRSPGRAPPILAPKPKLGGISSIVSRYENISTSDSGRPVAGTIPGRSNSTGKPSKPPKPTFTGPSRQSSLQNSASPPGTSTADDFNTRFPNIHIDMPITSPPTSASGSGESGTAHAIGSYTSSNRQAMETATSNGRARPQSMHFASPYSSESGKNFVAGGPSAVAEEAETDETYQGVANLRDRWQKMQSGPTSHQEVKQDGLSRRATTLAPNRWSRS